MAGSIINLFMWGYQDSYRIHIQILARNVLKNWVHRLMQKCYLLVLAALAVKMRIRYA